MKFARIVFYAAAIWASCDYSTVLHLQSDRQTGPAANHPGFYYGFASQPSYGKSRFW
jgi:hypothetical protein